MKLLFFIIIFTIIYAIYTFLIFPGRCDLKKHKEFRNINIAHRGLHSADKTIPENSMAAFDAAVKAGFGIELDIQLSKDKQIVVFHDSSLDRVCGVHGRVDEFTYAELKTFKLCNTDEHIPLFTDFLKKVDGRVPLVIELKNTRSNKYLCKAAYEILKNYKGVYCIESFQPYIVRWFKLNAPHILRGQLSASVRCLKPDLGLIPAFCLSRLLTNFYCRPQFISYEKFKLPLSARLCKYFGAARAVWTVRPGDDFKACEAASDIVIFEFYKPDIRY